MCRYGYIRGKTRASMVDDTTANVMLTSELEDVIGDVRLPFAQVYTLRVTLRATLRVLAKSLLSV